MPICNHALSVRPMREKEARNRPLIQNRPFTCQISMCLNSGGRWDNSVSEVSVVESHVANGVEVGVKLGRHKESFVEKITGIDLSRKGDELSELLIIIPTWKAQSGWLYSLAVSNS